jgi:nucleoside-diphosphate-sugar epimerase
MYREVTTMAHTILLAGAGGAIGKRLAPLLRNAGHDVFGTTRSRERADELRANRVTPVVVDVFDAAALVRALVPIRPDVVIHQLTDLPAGLDPNRMVEAVKRNARIRDEGTRNLVDASITAGARRLVAQSIAWAYAPSDVQHVEQDPLDLAAEGGRGVSVRGVAALESQVLDSPPLAGVVLRYGHLYGPGTGTGLGANPALHVDAAAYAALLAIDKGEPGVFNIAESGDYVSSAKAIRELGWDAEFRLDCN